MKGVFFKRKEFVHHGSNYFFLLDEISFKEGIRIKSILTKLSPLKVYIFPLNEAFKIFIKTLVMHALMLSCLGKKFSKGHLKVFFPPFFRK